MNTELGAQRVFTWLQMLTLQHTATLQHMNAELGAQYLFAWLQMLWFLK